jgi:hypothetical protein
MTRPTIRSAALKTSTRLLALVLLAASPVPAQTADPPAPPADLAELFPPDTLAYAEIVNPAELGPELAAVFKGTALEDSIAFVHKRKDAAENLLDLNGKKYLAWLGLVASPEMAGELKKLRVAVALTGFSDNGDPEFALVVLTHDSPAAGLAARAFVTLTPTLRKVGEVAKVPVFQYRSPNINHDPSGVPVIQKDRPLAEGPHEATFAYTPGLFVVGTSKNAIAHTLRRFAGEEKAAGLAGAAAFKEAAAAHRRTGLFYYVNFPEFCTRFDAANKARGTPDWAVRGLGDKPEPINLDFIAWFKLTANAKAVKSVAGCVRFRDGGLSATMAAVFDPAQKSPLLDFLSGPGVKAELLHHARGPAAFALGVTLPEKNRAAAVIGFLDAVAKANGELGRLPGDAVREMEQKLKVPIADGLIGKTRAVTVFLPTKQELPKGAKPMPTLVLHAEDAATAAAWEEFLPKLTGELSGAAKPPQPSTETIDGVKVFSLPGTGLPWNAPVHYARNGSAVAVGLDRKVVAQAVTANATASGAAALSPPPADAAAFGTVSLGEVVLGMLERPQPKGPVTARDDTLLLPNGNPLPESFLEELKKARKAFGESLASMPPATVTARRARNELHVELFQPKVQAGGLKAVIDAGAAWLDKLGSLSGTNRNGRFDFDRFER